MTLSACQIQNFFSTKELEIAPSRRRHIPAPYISNSRKKIRIWHPWRCLRFAQHTPRSAHHRPIGFGMQWAKIEGDQVKRIRFECTLLLRMLLSVSFLVFVSDSAAILLLLLALPLFSPLLSLLLTLLLLLFSLGEVSPVYCRVPFYAQQRAGSQA